MIRFVVLGLIVGCLVIALTAALDITPWWSSVVAGAVLGAGAVVYALWRIPLRQARRLRGLVTDKELFDIENEARKTLVQLLSGLGIVATIALTLYATNETRQAANRNLKLATQSEITQRFAQAIDQLKATVGTKKSLAPRIGGIYTLARMGESGEEDAGPIADILSAYVRAEAPRRREDERPYAARSGIFSSCEGSTIYRPSADVQAALRGLASLSDRFRISINLSDTDLSGAALSSANLRSANLRDAALVDANLQDADLRDAQLVETVLEGACLKDADLSETQQQEARFSQAHLRGADFRKACLKGTDLSGAYGLTEEQLIGACTDVNTSLPDDLHQPRCRLTNCTYGP